MRAQDAITKPDFEIPDLTEQQQKDAGLPADFWTAFDQFFTDVKALRPGSLASDICDLRRLVTGSELSKKCRVIAVDEDSALLAVIDRDQGSTSTVVAHDPAIVEAASRVWAGERNADRWHLWNVIASGHGPAWLFLPIIEKRRGHLEDVARDLRTTVTPEYHEPPLAGLNVARASKMRREWINAQSCARWPGAGSPPKEEQ